MLVQRVEAARWGSMEHAELEQQRVALEFVRAVGPQGARSLVVQAVEHYAWVPTVPLLLATMETLVLPEEAKVGEDELPGLADGLSAAVVVDDLPRLTQEAVLAWPREAGPMLAQVRALVLARTPLLAQQLQQQRSEAANPQQP